MQELATHNICLVTWRMKCSYEIHVLNLVVDYM